MKQLYLILLTTLFSTALHAQDVEDISGKILPGENFNNNTSDTLVYINNVILDRILKLKINFEIAEKKVTLLEEQVTLLEQRKFAGDSAIALKSMEAEYWYGKLQQNDEELLMQKKRNIELNHENNKIRRSRIYYFIAGVVASSIVYIAVK